MGLLWLSSLALCISTAALLAAFVLWRRVRRLQKALKERKSPVPSGVRAPFDSIELSLEAMLEELEERGREVVQKIERREEELARLFAQGDAFYRRIIAEPVSQGAAAPLEARRALSESTLQSDASESKTDVVRRLAKEGLDVLEIAKRLGIGKGEVQLILDLTD